MGNIFFILVQRHLAAINEMYNFGHIPIGIKIVSNSLQMSLFLTDECEFAIQLDEIYNNNDNYV